MLMRTDPFREFDRLAQQIAGTRARPAAMPMDAYRDGEQFVVELDLPGVDAQSIEVTVEKNVLTVQAQRDRTDGEGLELLIAERPYGAFSRQLFLGESLDTDRLTAAYADGVLSIRVPVAEKAKPRRVDVKAERSGSEAIETRSTEPADASS
jgi:HSP20 family protein